MEYNDALSAALIYSSLFSFPLTLQELQSRAIGKRITSDELESFLQSRHVKKEEMYYYLSGKNDMIRDRSVRKLISEKKKQYASTIIQYLSIIPSIQFIGLSGSVAVRNAVQTDDIDLFVVTSSRTLWVTRFFILLSLSLLGGRRKNNPDLLCLNMLIDERHITLPARRQDIYAAYELCQLDPIFDREDTYNVLLRQNLWTKRLLPNTLPKKPQITTNKSHPFLIQLLSWLDTPLAYIQKKHLQKLDIPLSQNEGILAFHNADLREKILTRFRDELHSYRLDKVIRVLYTRNDQ